MSGAMKLSPGMIAERVIVVGDPNRAKIVADLMKDMKPVMKNREYHTYNGTFNGVKISVASHGIGGGGASMCFEELINAGAKVIIRAGTCGSFQPHLREAALIIATAAVRSDGVTDRLVPTEFPAVADFDVVAALRDTLVKAQKTDKDLVFDVGMCATEGVFYDGPLGNRNELWQKAKVLAVEMEVSVLYVIASIRGIRAGAILNTDNYIFERMETGTYNPHREVVQKGTEKMCALVLEAISTVKV